MGDNRKRLVGIDLDGKRNCQTSGCHGWAIRFPKTSQEIFTFKAMTFVQDRGRVSFESMLAKSLKLGKNRSFIHFPEPSHKLCIFLSSYA